MEISNIRIGLALAVASLFLGFLLGAVFGAFEDNLKDHLSETGLAVLEEVYEGDNALMDKTVSKSWSYMKRAHMHWGGIGGACIGLLLVLSLTGISSGMKKIFSILVGIGSIGYPTYWLMAALRAPALGGTSIAKESLSWLAIPCAAFLLAGVIVTLYGILKKESNQ